MTNQEFMDMVLTNGKEIFNHDKYFAPVLIGNKTENEADPAEMVVVSLDPLMEHKDVLAAFIQKLRGKIRQLAFVTEAWRAVATPEELKKDDFIPVSQRSDKQDTALVTFYFGTETVLYMADLVGKDKDRTMTEWKKSDQSSLSGRLVDGRTNFEEFCPVPEEELVPDGPSDRSKKRS